MRKLNRRVTAAVSIVGVGAGLLSGCAKEEPITISQFDKITSSQGADCHIGVISTGNGERYAWLSAACAKPGDEVTVAAGKIGVAGDVTGNGLIPVTLDQKVAERATNAYPMVTVTPPSTDLSFVPVCAGAGGEFYDCGMVKEANGKVATVTGMTKTPYGTPVWIQATTSDDDTQSAQMLGIVSVPGNSKDEPTLVSFVPPSNSTDTDTGTSESVIPFDNSDANAEDAEGGPDGGNADNEPAVDGDSGNTSGDTPTR